MRKPKLVFWQASCSMNDRLYAIPMSAICKAYGHIASHYNFTEFGLPGWTGIHIEPYSYTQAAIIFEKVSLFISVKRYLQAPNSNSAEM